MSQIAEETGIGRATLYKYFSGVEPILIAWHERHVTEHLEHLQRLRDEPGDASSRLESVLQTYALIAFERHQLAQSSGRLCISASTSQDQRGRWSLSSSAC